MLKLIVIVALSVSAAHGGALPAIECVDNYTPGTELAGPCGPHGERCNFQDPTNVFVLGCSDDCLANHNAPSGKCDKAGVCVCARNERLIIPDKPSKSIQCNDPMKQHLYNKICDEDCRCAHNAFFGVCNYATQACHCRGRYRGGRTDCPYPDGNAFFLASGAIYHELGKPVDQFVNGYGK